MTDSITAIAERVIRLEKRLAEAEQVDYSNPFAYYVLYSRGTSDQSITADTPTIIDFNNKISDIHGLVTTGSSWVYTAPEAGLYTVAANVLTSSQTYDANDYVVFYVEQTGLGHIRSPYTYFSHVTHTTELNISWMIEIHLAAAVTISVKLRYNSNGEDLKVKTDTNKSNVTIFKMRSW